MCGVVGLFLKDRSLEPRLGDLLAGMLEVTTDRGPDSAGFAIYGKGDSDHVKLTLRGRDLDSVAGGLTSAIGDAVGDTRRYSHLVLSFATERQTPIRNWLAVERPDRDDRRCPSLLDGTRPMSR